MTATLPKLGLFCRKHRPWVASCLLGLFLLVKFFAVSEVFHHALHADAAGSEHQCAITLISQGQVTTPGIAVGLPVMVAGFLLVLACVRFFSFSSFDFRLASPRGPPCG